jgi:hypothetical protein
MPKQTERTVPQILDAFLAGPKDSKARNDFVKDVGLDNNGPLSVENALAFFWVLTEEYRKSAVFKNKLTQTCSYNEPFKELAEELGLI